jgi:hypothetical protein
MIEAYQDGADSPPDVRRLQIAVAQLSLVHAEGRQLAEGFDGAACIAAVACSVVL